MRHELRGHAGDFFEGQQRTVRQVGVVLVEDFLGHAVTAAEIAPVGDADAQVAQRAAQGITEQAGGSHRHGGDARHGVDETLIDQGNDTFGHSVIIDDTLRGSAGQAASTRPDTRVLVGVALQPMA
ncbi:hypothetical protein D9M68_840970 [compost metagenome]